MKRLAPIPQRLSRGLLQVLRDDSGATMTEFIITLPVFIMVFAGIANLTRLNRAVMTTNALAYEEMWDRALKVQLVAPGTHTSARHGGSGVKANMNVYHGKQPDDVVQQIVRRETNDMGSGLAEKGTLGESRARVRSSHRLVKFRYLQDAEVTSEINGVVGKSALARRLFDDSNTAPTVSGNPSGAFGQLSGLLSGSGTRLFHATAVRYGEEVGRKAETVDILGQLYYIHQYYSTLVSPAWQREEVATAVARTAMNGLKPYDQLLGISRTQRVEQVSQDTPPKIKGAFSD